MIPLFLPFVVLILLPSLHPDVLYLEEVISLALDRIDGVDSDSFKASHEASSLRHMKKVSLSIRTPFL